MNALTATITVMPKNIQVSVLLCAGLLAGCAADRPLTTPNVMASLRAELPAAAPNPQTKVPARVSDALAEPAPAPAAPLPEPRIDLLVNNAQAREVFLAIVADTRYSMLMHPDVKGTLSVTLRGVTVKEALESIRDVYGYDFKMEGRRIVIYAPTLQTRVFTINYPNSQRSGTSDLRVSTGGQTVSSGGSGGTAGGSNNPNTPNGGSSGANNTTITQAESSHVSTTSKTDFWTEISTAIKGLLGAEGRSVVVSPHAGIIAVRAMPDELQQVDRFLKAAQIAVERQVMLEAKVVQVELSDGYQSGVNWSGLIRDSGNLLGIGSGVAGASALAQSGNAALNSSTLSGAGVFGLALSTNNFGAVLGFLETQGNVQTLSSPRVATLNNQKAVLKVGTDDFFVTSVSGGSNTPANSTTPAATTMPTVSLTSFFSGISLDVTPQVDGDTNVTLHVHPSLTKVTEVTKLIDLGAVGSYKLPTASSTVNETDTVVRLQDGNIVAIGGLMQMESSNRSAGLPGTTGSTFLTSLFGNKAKLGSKKEVIVLIKPTIIRSVADWEALTRRARMALDDMDDASTRVIRMDGGAAPAPGAAK